MNDLRMHRPQPLLRLSALAAALWLAGCSFIPSYERPAAPVAGSFANAPAAAPTAPEGATRSAADIDWQDFFQDARLKRLIGLSLQNNRDLRVAVLTIEQTRAKLQVARADLLPTVNAGITGSRGA